MKNNTKFDTLIDDVQNIRNQTQIKYNFSCKLSNTYDRRYVDQQNEPAKNGNS